MARRRSATKGKPKRRVEPRFDAPTVPSLRAERRSPRRRGKPKRSFLVRAAGFVSYWSLVLGLWGGIAVAGVFAFYGLQMPAADTWRVPQRPANIRILDRDGHLIAHRGLGGANLSLDEMTPWLPQAVIAIEDRRFRSHFGFDPIGFARAMVRNASAGRMREGGSTITQQLAKNLFLSPERSVGRKVQELILAFWLEAKYSKSEILELYLNRVYFGAGATGADAASRTYFARGADSLTLRQAATLAGLLKAPSRLSPLKHPRRAARRTELVLDAMEREGFVTPHERARADRDRAAPVAVDGSHLHVADMVEREVERLLGRVNRDITVSVTIDRSFQRDATLALFSRIDTQGEQARVSEGALVSLAPDGAIRALVGGRRYRRSQFNRASQAKRQPGSAFKPFLWLAALERGWTPDHPLSDTPITTGKWRPRNHGDYRGLVTLSDALAHSSNVAAARLVRRIGPERLKEAAARLGIESSLKANPTLALGTSEVTPLELAQAYAPFANGGVKVFPYLVTAIRDGRGRTLYERSPLRGHPVIAAQHADAMAAMLQGVVDRGTGRKAAVRGFQAAGKTGTSQNARDAWFVGFTGHLVTAVWMGNDDASPTRTTGGGLAADVWGRFMRDAHRDLAPVRRVRSVAWPLSTGSVAFPRPVLRPKADVGERPATKGERKRATRLIDLILNREP